MARESIPEDPSDARILLDHLPPDLAAVVADAAEREHLPVGDLIARSLRVGLARSAVAARSKDHVISSGDADTVAALVTDCGSTIARAGHVTPSAWLAAQATPGDEVTEEELTELSLRLVEETRAARRCQWSTPISSATQDAW